MINQFTTLAQDPRLSFLGNVRVGRDISLAELRSHYNAVVLSYGAESDRKLGVPGEVRAGWAAGSSACNRGTGGVEVVSGVEQGGYIEARQMPTLGPWFPAELL